MDSRPSNAIEMKFGGSAGSNLYSPSVSSSKGSCEVQTHESHKLIEQIINSIFDEQKGIEYQVSSSECSSAPAKLNPPKSDARLKNWQHNLRVRKKVTTAIKDKTGRTPSGVLINRAANVDERDKYTVKRLLDYADRLNPLALLNRKTLKLREYEKPDTCEHVHELRETLPKPERKGKTKVEITGLPAIIRKELIAKETSQAAKKRKTDWLKSKELEKRIEEKCSDIQRVIEFFPNVKEIQIQGEGIASELRHIKITHDPEIEFLGSSSLKDISSDTTPICETSIEAKSTLPEEPPEYGIKINGEIFNEIFKRSSRTIEIKIDFICFPFEEVKKSVLVIENIGKKVISFELLPRRYFYKCKNLLRSISEEFVLDKRPFRLIAGEKREIVVLFQPRFINITKEKWVLKIDPQFFCRKVDAVIIKLNGICKPSTEYITKLNEEERIILQSSNLEMLNNVTGTLASITPLIEPLEAHCPYKRTLTDTELFEYYNLGLTCNRYHNLVLLKDIYQRVKNPRDHEWDLKIDTLKSMILRLKAPVQRAFYFQEMLNVLEDMSGKPLEVEKKLIESPERDRTRFVYVRGIICGAIDEWEEKAIKIEESFLKAELQYFYKKLDEEEEEEDEEIKEKVKDADFDLDMILNKIDYSQLDYTEVNKICLKRMRHRKVFRDSLYMQTYDHLCNVAENIVSIIESTELF